MEDKMSDVLSGDKLQRIRELNDRLRQTFCGGRVMLTSSIAEIYNDEKTALLTAIRGFTSFDDDNDPHGEHDMVFVEVRGERYWAKVDYYDTDMRYLSDDPSDPAITRRVMTIGHASEY
jgi:hypothetical protein